MKILFPSWQDSLHPSAGRSERCLLEVEKRWVPTRSEAPKRLLHSAAHGLARCAEEVPPDELVAIHDVVDACLHLGFRSKW